jgi:hypothetical protein
VERASADLHRREIDLETNEKRVSELEAKARKAQVGSGCIGRCVHILAGWAGWPVLKV